MNITTTHSHQIATTFASSLVAAMALLLVPAAAHASRLPSDPFDFAPTPLVQTRMVLDAQAANVWAALRELRSDVTGTY